MVILKGGYMEQEKWVNCCLKGYEGYLVSNYGIVKNPKGKQVKWHIRKTKQRERPFVYLHYKDENNIKHQTITSIAHLVYLHFGENKPKHKRYGVFCKDGNPLNNYIENLFVFCPSDKKPTAEQEEIYINEVYHCIDAYFSKTGFKGYKIKGLDIENIKQDSALMIWKYLHCYDCKRNFYSFCARYARFCALKAYKKWKDGFIENYI